MKLSPSRRDVLPSSLTSSTPWVTGSVTRFKYGFVVRFYLSVIGLDYITALNEDHGLHAAHWETTALQNLHEHSEMKSRSADSLHKKCWNSVVGDGFREVHVGWYISRSLRPTIAHLKSTLSRAQDTNDSALRSLRFEAQRLVV